MMCEMKSCCLCLHHSIMHQKKNYLHGLSDPLYASHIMVSKPFNICFISYIFISKPGYAYDNIRAPLTCG